MPYTIEKDPVHLVVADAAPFIIHPEVQAAEIGPRDAHAAAASSDVEADMPQAL